MTGHDQKFRDPVAIDTDLHGVGGIRYSREWYVAPPVKGTGFVITGCVWNDAGDTQLVYEWRAELPPESRR